MPTYHQYLDRSPGIAYQDIWAYQPHTNGVLYGTEECIDQDVAWLKPTDAERLGYETQKPSALLARIIESSCPPGGIVMDPFCGCGTAIAAAHNLGRRWIGIDITHLAIALIRRRLGDHFGETVSAQYELRGTPKDLDGARALAKIDRYQFEWWAVDLVDAWPAKGKKKGADKGFDGYIYFHDEPDTKKTKKILVQAKSGHVGVSQVRDFGHVVHREKAQMGLFVTLEDPTQDMRTEAVKMGFYESPWDGKKYPRLQILTIEAVLSGQEPKRPPRRQVDATFKKAPKAKKKGPDAKELF